MADWIVQQNELFVQAQTNFLGPQAVEADTYFVKYLTDAWDWFTQWDFGNWKWESVQTAPWWPDTAPTYMKLWSGTPPDYLTFPPWWEQPSWWLANYRLWQMDNGIAYYLKYPDMVTIYVKPIYEKGEKIEITTPNDIEAMRLRTTDLFVNVDSVVLKDTGEINVYKYFPGEGG